MTPQRQRWTVFAILNGIVVCLGVFWLVSGLIAITTPWWLAKEAVSAALGPMFSLMDTSGYVFIHPDDGSGVLILDWPTGRLCCPVYGFGLGIMGCGIIAALTPSVLMRRIQDNATHSVAPARVT